MILINSCAKKSYQLPLTEKECLHSDYLRNYYYEGIADAVIFASDEVREGVFFSDYTYELLENPSENLSVEEFAKQKGFQVTYNRITNAALEGWIMEENRKDN